MASTIDITASSGQAQASINQINNTLRVLQRTLRSTGREIERTPDIDFRNSTRSVNAFSDSINRANVFVGSFLANIASTALQAFSDRVFRVGVEMDALRTRVIALTGNIQDGESHFQRLFQIAQDLGVPFQALVESTLQLRNYGFESTSEIERLARQLSVLSGGSAQSIERLGRALGQVVGGGRVALEELNQFSDVIPIFNALSEVVGVSTSEIRDMVSRSEISVEQLLEALNRLEQGSFGEAAAAQAGTFQAEIQRLNNNLDNFIVNVVEKYGPTVNAFLEKINENFGLIATTLGIITTLFGLNLFKNIFGGVSLRVFNGITSILQKQENILSNRLDLQKQFLDTEKTLAKTGRSIDTGLSKRVDFLKDVVSRANDRTQTFKNSLENASKSGSKLKVVLTALAAPFRGLIAVFQGAAAIIGVTTGALAGIIGVIALVTTGIISMVSSMRRAKKEIGELGEAVKKTDNELNIFGKSWFAIGDALNRGIYFPIREFQLLEVRIKAAERQVKSFQDLINAGGRERRFDRERNTFSFTGDFLNLDELKSKLDGAKANLREVLVEYIKFNRRVRQINNDLPSLDLFRTDDTLDSILEDMKAIPPVWVKALQEIVDAYVKAREEIRKKDIIGLFEEEVDKLRAHAGIIETALNNIATNKVEIPLDNSSVEYLAELLDRVRERIEELTATPSRARPERTFETINNSMESIRNLAASARDTLSGINSEFEKAVKHARSVAENEEAINNKVDQQINLYKDVLAQAELIRNVTSPLNPAFKFLENYIAGILGKLADLEANIPFTTGAVKDLRSELEKLFNIDISTGFGDFLPPESEFGRALKSIEKITEAIQVAGSAMGDFLNTWVDTINNIVNVQIQLLQQELDAFTLRRQRAEEDLRRMLQKEEEALRRQFEAGIITFEDYYGRLDQARAEDEKKKEELRKKEAEYQDKINALRYQAELQAFHIGRAQALAQLAFNSAIAIIRTFADFPYPVALGLSTLIGGTALAQKALILSQQPPPPPAATPFAEGGIVAGGRGGVRGLIGEGSSDELITPISERTRRAIEQGLSGGIVVNFNGTFIEERNAAKKLDKVLKTNRRAGVI